jgi:putative ABC transport system permease protein
MRAGAHDEALPMKYAGLLWSALSKRMFRTILTILSITVAFILFGLLHGVTSAIDHEMSQFAATRLSVFNSVEQQPLPISYREQIGKLAFVHRVDAFTPFISYFRAPSNRVLAGGIGSANDMQLPEELHLSAEYAKTFATSRTAAIADRKLAEKYGWKIGDKVPLHSRELNRDGTTVWTFDLVGLYDVPKHSAFGGLFYFRHDYLDAARVNGAGTAGSFLVYTTDPSHNLEVEAAIDKRFANSSAQTTTRSEMEWYQAASGEAIDFNLLVTSVLGATLFTLLLVTANTMMESVRQRRPELAILKTIGFSDRSVLVLVFVEAFALYAIGAILGLFLSRLFFPFVGPVDTTLDPLPLPLSVYLQGAALAIGATVLSAVVPAVRAQRLSIVDALRRR